MRFGCLFWARRGVPGGLEVGRSIVVLFIVSDSGASLP
jgi:hypothetical protein